MPSLDETVEFFAFTVVVDEFVAGELRHRVGGEQDGLDGIGDAARYGSNDLTHRPHRCESPFFQSGEAFGPCEAADEAEERERELRAAADGCDRHVFGDLGGGGELVVGDEERVALVVAGDQGLARGQFERMAPGEVAVITGDPCLAVDDFPHGQARHRDEVEAAVRFGFP
ncbi:MAG: hypothetical protein R3F65_03195 [bacterium]